ncbi:hypothetical protein CDAR_304561 [Caerostris darwini]|uniref:Uncharacterized protein n=1 Tax=Caerostris darwini TaxID=1538125 RepID=A0AAV4NKS0_9ARAC|nr:hypothetical protein CDAR_304561 [Caerostris darwini]
MKLLILLPPPFIMKNIISSRSASFPEEPPSKRTPLPPNGLNDNYHIVYVSFQNRVSERGKNESTESHRHNFPDPISPGERENEMGT